MSFKDKMEVGLKPDAPYRSENLPDFQQGDPSSEVAAESGEGTTQDQAREDCAEPVPKPKPRAQSAGPRRQSSETARKLKQ